MAATPVEPCGTVQRQATLPPPLPLVVVIGPTGAGKSAAAVRIALAVRRRYPDATPHILNADVSQMYPGLPVATNKPRDGDIDTGGVPHHFMSQLGPRAPYSAHQFKLDVEALVRRTRAEEARPLFILCGGTHYYVQSALFEGEMASDVIGGGGGVDDTSLPQPAVVRAGETPWEALHRIDPECAARWHPNDTQRIRRCIELYEQSGGLRLPSTLLAGGEGSTFKLRQSVVGDAMVITIVVDAPREVLEARINRRADGMLGRGLWAEVQDFYECSATMSGGDAAAAATAPPFLARAIGYKEFLPLLEQRRSDRGQVVGGEDGERLPLLSAAIAQVKANTRRYALQQQQWVRNRFIGRYAECLQPHFYTVDSIAEEQDASAGGDHGADGGAAVVVGVAARLVLDVIAAAEDGCVVSSLMPQPTDGRWRHIVPSPATASAAACGGDSTSNDMRTHRCDVCDITLCGVAQFDLHMHSNRHRGALRRAKERAERAEWKQRATADDPSGCQRAPQQPPAST